MSGSISDFKANFNKEIARPSRFDVEVPIPLGMIPYYKYARQLKFRCESAQFPGRTLATVGQKSYNIEEMFPYQTTYDKIALTFIVSSDMDEKKFFDAWLDWINPSINYNFRYKQDYAVALRINQYDAENKITYSVDLMDAYPIAINQMELDWSSDGYHKLTVSFEYTTWKNNSIEALAMQILEDGISRGLTTRTTSALGDDLPTLNTPEVVNMSDDITMKNAFNPDVDYR